MRLFSVRRFNILNKNFKGWCQDPLQVAQICKNEFEQNVKSTLALAEELCGNTFTFREHWEMERTNISVTFNGKIDFEHVPFGDGEWTYALNRHTCFVILAKAYLYTNDIKYYNAFEQIATQWLETAKLNEKTKKGSWRSLEAGLRIETWLRAICIFKDIISKNLLEAMNESLLVHGEYLKNTSADFHILSNWGVLQDHGLFLLGLYFDNSDWCTLACNRLERNINIQVMRDGSHWEQSPMYHCEVLHCFIDVLTVGYQNNYKFSKTLEQATHNMCKGLSLWIKPNGNLVMQGDSDDINAQDILAQGAYLFDDASLKFCAHSKYFEENLWDFGTQFIEKYQKIEATPPQNPSQALPDSGNYFMRNDNSETSVWMHFHCGCLGSGHGHADQLHIDLCAYGDDILTDTGRYTYVDSPIRCTLKSAKSHNTCTVNGAEFSEQLDSWGYKTIANPLKGEFVTTNYADFVSGAHLGYFNDGVFTRRRVVFIKPDIYVVFDTFASNNNNENSYEQYFHFGKGEVSISENKVNFTGKNSNAKVLCLNAQEISLSDADISYEYNLLEKCKKLSTKTNANKGVCLVTVLSVAKNGEANNITAEIVPITARRKNTVLPLERALGVKINKNGKEYTLLSTNEEIISEVELLEANGHCGYGKMVIFAQDLPETGICLEW